MADVRFLDHTLDFSWQLQAACRGADPLIFFPSRGENSLLLRAKAICQTCPVRQDCLEQALRDGEKHGVFGGTSERERRRLRSLQLRQARQQEMLPQP